MTDFPQLAAQCAAVTPPHLLARIVQVESGHNPYAIGVVGGRLARQPRTSQEAEITAQALHQAGWNFSMGLGQVNRYNLPKYGLNYQSVFEPCANLRAASAIFNECHQRAKAKYADPHATLAALSCYYSGNFTRGFQKEGRDQRSYVQRVVETKAPTATGTELLPIPVIPTGKQPATSRQQTGNTRATSAPINSPPPQNAASGKLQHLRGGGQPRVKELRGQ